MSKKAVTDQDSDQVKDVENRCRLALVLNGDQAAALDAGTLGDILRAGDVSSIIFTPQTSDGLMDEAQWQPLVEPLVEMAQKSGTAAIVTDYSRTAGRIGADGFQTGQDPTEVGEAIEKYTPKMMVGAGNVKTRHTALVIGELQPDYLMFGKPGGDTREEPHPKNVELGGWWAAMVEIPAIVLGGTAIESVVEVAKSGAEFVALGTAIFAPQDNVIDIKGAAERVRQANKLLDGHAPNFQTNED
ncbi:MAG: thiamine phosphate synthase [Rhizobiaceae bacterium]